MTRFYRHMKLFKQRGFAAQFPRVVAAAHLSMNTRVDTELHARVDEVLKSHSNIVEVTKGGNFAYRTFASRVMTAVEKKDLPGLKIELDGKASYLFRNLTTLSHVATKKNEGEFVEYVRGLIDGVNASVLLSLIQINTAADYRVIDNKGTTTVQSANYSPVIAEIQGVARANCTEPRLAWKDRSVQDVAESRGAVSVDQQ